MSAFAQAVVLLSNDPLGSTSSARSHSPTLTCLDTTGRGSVSCSGLMRMETAEDAVISLNRLLTPCVDSFSKEVTFCVDSFKRSDTVGANLLCPFKSLLSMLMAKRMEFRPAPNREESGVCAVEQNPTPDARTRCRHRSYTGGCTLILHAEKNRATPITGVSRHQLPQEPSLSEFSRYLSGGRLRSKFWAQTDWVKPQHGHLRALRAWSSHLQPL